MSRSKYLLLLPIFWMIFSCSTMEELDTIPTPDSPITQNSIPLPTVESMRAVNLEPGYRADDMLLSNGSNRLAFKISVPELEEGEKVPLVIALHWAGDNQTYVEFMDCLVQPALSQTKAIIFGPSEGSSTWWLPANESRLVTFINLAKEQWPVDSTKIAILGYSNGGTSSWYFAAEHADLISAAIPIAGSYFEVDKIDIPTYVIHGENDELFSHSTSKRTIEQLSNNGSNITLTTAIGLSHYEACNYTNHLRDAGFWLTNIAWK